MENPAESKPKADANARKVCPEVQRLIERVVVPALVNRYIKELKEGKNPRGPLGNTGIRAMTSSEPANLIEWRGNGGRLFTCGRPGRATYGRQRHQIGEDTINLWVKGLPRADVLHIISLLGQKTDGFSEFAYYPFRSSREVGPKPTFQEWLDQRYGHRFVVHEFPTTDARGIQPDLLESVKSRVLSLLSSGDTVIVVDSAGAERTARVCEAVGFKRVPIKA